MTNLLTPPGDDRLKFTATMRLPVPLSPTVDPRGKGMRLLLVSKSGATILDATIPGGQYSPAAGAGWNASGRSWTYRNDGLGSPAIVGLRRIGVKLAVTPRRARLRVAVTGRDGSYPVELDGMPIGVTVVIDSPFARTGQCGEGAFSLPGCKYNPRRGTLRCRG